MSDAIILFKNCEFEKLYLINSLISLIGKLFMWYLFILYGIY